LPYYPIHQRKAVLQHILIATKVRHELKKLDGLALEPNAKAISCAYNKVCFELSHDASFVNFIDNCTFLEKITVPFEDSKTYFDAFGVSSLLDESHYADIAQFYRFRNSDLTKLIENFDINRLPTDRKRCDELNIAYLTNPPMEKLILDIPQSTYLFASNAAQFIASDTSITGQTSSPNNPSKFSKHLSKKLFVNVPNFEEALLNPKALTPEIRDTLKKLFKEFNDIPAEFTNCNVKSSLHYIKQHGNPHYFEYSEAPFLPHFTTPLKRKYKNNLAILRRTRQQRCQRNSRSAAR